jgi:hypothetical protein
LSLRYRLRFLSNNDLVFVGELRYLARVFVALL